ncbi:MAG: glycoside hydrolase family 15 protein [Bacteroidota bacterium]
MPIMPKTCEPLVERSIRIIGDNQHPSGAYVASPAFPNYAYCWLRDGTFTAYAMDLFREHGSARAYHVWAARSVEANRAIVLEVVRSARAGRKPDPQGVLPARFTLDGGIDASDWPNFQLDGYGTWLWGLAEHVRLTGDRSVLEQAGEAVRLVLDYLAAVWMMPNHDCWEEHGDQLHTSTLACLAGGTAHFAALAEDLKAGALAEEIREYILGHSIVDGRLGKFCNADAAAQSRPQADPVGAGGAGGPAVLVGEGVSGRRRDERRRAGLGREVDASLLWVAVPFGVLDPLDPRMTRTVEKIERDLAKGGGVRRYATDTYYGGGLWLLLSAWLGWYYCRVGRLAEASLCLDWIEAQADEEGLMPEQVSADLVEPAYYQPWVDRWGPVAKPLLWSHAMYLVLWHELHG